MYKNSLKLIFCLMTIIFSLQVNAEQLTTFNKDTDSCYINTTTEPQYSVSFILPKTRQPLTVSSTPDNKDLIMGSTDLVLRFYQAYGDGSSTGWQTSVKTPTVTLNGEPLSLYNAFSYGNQEAFQFGALSLGYDEYAQYLVVTIPSVINNHYNRLTITGSFEQIAYMSATVYHYGSVDWQLEKFDNTDFTVLNNACNPYITKNPSVFYYTNSITNMPPDSSSDIKIHPQGDLPKISADESNNGKLGVYRLDKFDSKQMVADDIIDDGCTQSYLFAEKSSTKQEVLILRIKLPTTFIDDDTPNKIFGDYQTRYFSVSANVDPTQHSSNPLGFWTVNARMLKQYADKDGYVYVFFAPNDYAQRIALEQGTPATQPPVMTWGKYKGFLLGNPDYAIIMRYKNPNSAWIGSPANAICYNSPDQLEPLSYNELGAYTPEIYADTLYNFMHGNIGAVNMNNMWPASNF